MLFLLTRIIALAGIVLFVICFSTLPFQHRRLLFLLPPRRKFFFYLFSLAAKMAKADGRVSEDEIRLFRGYVRSNFQITRLEQRQAVFTFQRATDSTTTFSELAALFVREYRSEPAILFSMLNLLGDIAAADGTVAGCEYALLREFSELIHMIPERFVSMMSQKFKLLGVKVLLEDSYQEPPFAENTENDQTNPLQKAYRTLGLPIDASWQHIRATYRTLAKQYHPDRLRSIGVPAGGLQSATEHFRTLKDAYELIREQRGK